MERAYIDNQEYIRNNITVDPYAMQALKEQQALRVAATRKRKMVNNQLIIQMLILNCIMTQ